MIGDIDWAHPLNRQHPMTLGAKAILLGSHNHRGKRWYDLTANRNHGTLTNMHPASDWVRGPVNGMVSLDFNGSSNYVSLGDSPQWSLAVSGRESSIVALVRVDSNADRWLCGVDGEWGLTIRPISGGFYWRLDAFGANTGTASALPLGEWGCVALRWVAGTSADIWWNGSLYRTTSLTDTSADSGNPLLIGGRNASREFFDGAIAWVAVYDRCLSSAEFKWFDANRTLEPMLNKIEPTRKGAPVGGGGGGFNPAWAMNSTVVAGVNCA